MIEFNIQSNKEWSQEIMTSCDDKRGTWADTLGRWGCLVTCLANIKQDYENKIFTPKELNNSLKENKGYYFLSGETNEERNASYLDTKVLAKMWNCIIHKDLTLCKGAYTIARFKKKQHFVNILNYNILKNRFLIFDVANNKTYFVLRRAIKYFYEVIFND